MIYVQTLWLAERSFQQPKIGFPVDIKYPSSLPVISFKAVQTSSIIYQQGEAQPSLKPSRTRPSVRLHSNLKHKCLGLLSRRSRFPKRAFRTISQCRWEQLRLFAEVSSSQLDFICTLSFPSFPPDRKATVLRPLPSKLSPVRDGIRSLPHTRTFSLEVGQTSFSCQTGIEALISCSASLPSVRPNSTVTQLDFTASFEMLALCMCVFSYHRGQLKRSFALNGVFFPLMKELVLSGSLTGFNL